MRNTLLATTALAFAGAGVMAVAPASAADMMSVGVGGYMQQWVGMSSVSDTANAAVEGGVAQQSDTEIFFKGKLEADNGLTFSVKVELEGNGSGAIDESQATVRGAFGAVVLGAEDGASVLTHHGVRDAGFGMLCGDMGKWINGIDGCGPGGMGTAGHGLGDRNQMSYFSPRVNGVQFGATYIPNTAQEDGSAALHNNDNDAWSLGGNYTGEFGGTNIAVSAGYYQAGQTMAAVALKSGMNDDKITVGEYMDNVAAIEAGAEALDTGVADGSTLGDVAQAAHEALESNAGAFDTMASKTDARTVSNFGLQVGLGAFSFDIAYLAQDSGAYMVAKSPIVNVVSGHSWDDDGDADTADVAESADNNDPSNDDARTVLVKDTSKDNEVVAFGVMYSDGPMAVSLAHTMVEADDGTEQSGTMLSGSYLLTPGVAWRTSLIAAEKDRSDGTSVEGTGFVTGITLNF